MPYIRQVLTMASLTFSSSTLSACLGSMCVEEDIKNIAKVTVDITEHAHEVGLESHEFLPLLRQRVNIEYRDINEDTWRPCQVNLTHATPQPDDEYPTHIKAIGNCRISDLTPGKTVRVFIRARFDDIASKSVAASSGVNDCNQLQKPDQSVQLKWN